MLAALTVLKLIGGRFMALPVRVRHYLELGVLVVIFMTWWTLHFEHKAVTEKLAAINHETALVTAAAQKHIQQLNADYTKGVQDREKEHQAQLAQRDADHTADLNRVRKLDADRQARAMLDSTAAGRAAQLAEDERRLTSLEQVAAGLADALRSSDDNLNLCYADRDSLTGK